MSGNETWKPLMTLCSLLATFEKDLPSKTSPNSKDSAAEVRKSLNSYMDATNNLVKGLATVIEEISKDYLEEKNTRTKLSKSADTLCSNQTSAAALNGIKDLKTDLLSSMRSFTIHDVDNNSLPEPPSGLKFITKAQFADFLKIPKNLQTDLSFNRFNKKNSGKSTLIVKCKDINNKMDIEKIVKTSYKTASNLPKYVHHFVKKIRPLYVSLGTKLSNVSCADPFIMIKPTRNGDKLSVFSKDHSNPDSIWEFVESLNLPYPKNIIDSGHLSQTCKSSFLSSSDINQCVAANYEL